MTTDATPEAFSEQPDNLIRMCNDLPEPAQPRLLMQKPQRVYSSPASGVGADGCRTQSSHQ